MININDSIQLKNVISQKYYLNYKDFDKAIKMFLNNIGELGVQITSFPFYSLNAVPVEDENIGIEIFIAVEEDYVDVPENMKFRSYFNIENMISINVIDDFEKNSQVAESELRKFMSDNNLTQITPLFTVFCGNDSFQYVSLKVGVND